jgi:hypothetical protein
MSEKHIPTEKELNRMRLERKVRDKERERQEAERHEQEAAASRPRRQARFQRKVERKRREEDEAWMALGDDEASERKSVGKSTQSENEAKDRQRRARPKRRS